MLRAFPGAGLAPISYGASFQGTGTGDFLTVEIPDETSVLTGPNAEVWHADAGTRSGV
jgi:hypothetical protein